jgi:hypothetical protein
MLALALCHIEIFRRQRQALRNEKSRAQRALATLILARTASFAARMRVAERLRRSDAVTLSERNLEFKRDAAARATWTALHAGATPPSAGR